MCTLCKCKFKPACSKQDAFHICGSDYSSKLCEIVNFSLFDLTRPICGKMCTLLASQIPICVPRHFYHFVGILFSFSALTNFNYKKNNKKQLQSLIKVRPPYPSACFRFQDVSGSTCLRVGAHRGFTS